VSRKNPRIALHDRINGDSTSSPNGGHSPLEPFRKDLTPGLLFLAAMLLFAPRLGVPPKYMYDEVYHGYTAGQYAAGNPDAYVWDTKAPEHGVAYMWNHPPVGVLMITGGILLWGDVPFGWRFSSAVFGAIGVLLVYLLALRIMRDRMMAALAACLVLVDTLWFVQSRIGMLDMFGTVFALATLLSLYGFLTSRADRVAPALMRTGLFLGLALATKWNAAFLAAFTGLLVLYRSWVCARRAREFPGPATRSAWHAHLIWVPVSLVLVPALVYLAAYIPFFATGHDWDQFVELQRQIFFYHSQLEEIHTYQSAWWQWPLALRPVWYSVTYAGDTVAHIYANGSMLLYWSFLPAVVALAVRLWRESNPALSVLLIGFFGQWLPWALSPRSAFIYHFLPAVPFGALAVAVAAVTLYRRGGVWRWAVLVYLAALVAYFVFFYPIHAAVPLSREAFAARMWFPSWR
jgi:dolichyl-phosphate-mannose--protein O-mannosyl transferase